MEFNVNDRATVRLTEHGKRILEEYHEPVRLSPKTHAYFRKQWETDGPVEFAVWELMNIFGPVLYMGSTQVPVVNNRITVECQP